MTLRNMRERVGKTQAEMAEILGITRNYLALMESGKRPEQPDILQQAQLIVNKSTADLSADEWKARAIAAEAKLDKLRQMIEALLQVFSS